MILINGISFLEFKKDVEPKSNEAALVAHIEDAFKKIRGKKNNIIIDPHPSRIRKTMDDQGNVIEEHSNGRTDKNTHPFVFRGMTYLYSWIKGMNPKDKKGNVKTEAVDYTGGTMQFNPQRDTEEIFYRICVLQSCGVVDEYRKWQQERKNDIEYIVRDREADALFITAAEEVKAQFYKHVYGDITISKEDLMCYVRAFGIKNTDSFTDDMVKQAIKNKVINTDGSVNMANFKIFKDATEEDTRANDAAALRQGIIDGLILLDETKDGKKAYYSTKGKDKQKDKYITTVELADDYEEALIDFVVGSTAQRSKLLTYLKGGGAVSYSGSKGGGAGNIVITND